jgi:hypothetical protein
MARIYRVVVRGQFADLDEAARARLLAEVGEHDLMRSSFTADGTLSYDERLVAFNVRYEDRSPDDDPDPETTVVNRAMERTERRLTSMGVSGKHLRATATDMASMWR